MCSKTARHPKRTGKDPDPELVPHAAVERSEPVNMADEKPHPATSSEHFVEQCVFPVEPEQLELNIEATRLDIVLKHERPEQESSRGGSIC